MDLNPVTYNQHPGLNQSLLKKITNPPLFKKLQDKVDDKLPTEEQIIGSYVDTCLLTPSEKDKKYVVLKAPVPTGQMLTYCDHLIRIYTTNYKTGSISDHYSIAESCYHFAEFKRDSFEKVQERYKVEGAAYVEERLEIIYSGKTAITQEQQQIALTAINGVINNPQARMFLLENEFDNYVQVALYSEQKFKTPTGDETIQMKGLLDKVVVDRINNIIYVIDLKTTSSSLYHQVYRVGNTFSESGITGFVGDMLKYDYLFQLFWYTLLVGNNKDIFKITEETKIRNLLIATSTTYVDSKVYDVTKLTVTDGRMKFEEYMARYIWHTTYGFDKVWGEAEDGIIRLGQ